jgi:quercetin dioxygenase-like cupin family protein
MRLKRLTDQAYVEGAIKDSARWFQVSIKVRKLSEEPGVDEQEEGYSGVNSIWAVLKREDLAGFSSRFFRIEPGGHTPVHAHDREHVAVVIRGKVRVDGGPYITEAGEGSIIDVPPKIQHRFSNPAKEGLVLLIMNLFPEPSAHEAGATSED